MRDLIYLKYKLTERKVKVLYKGVDICNIQYKNKKLSKNKSHKILFVKSDFQRGGLRILINALCCIEKKSFNLTVAGPQEKYSALINSWIPEKSNIELNLVGQVSPEEVKSLMLSSDMFILPAIKEALGVANMEALAIGLPVVSTNVGGIPEVLDYGNVGWLCKPNDSIDLAKTINQCINSDDLRNEKAMLGVIHVANIFDKASLITNFENIIQNIGCE